MISPPIGALLPGTLIVFLPVNRVADAVGESVGLATTAVSVGELTGVEETGVVVGLAVALLGCADGFADGLAAWLGDGVTEGLAWWPRLGEALDDGLGTGVVGLGPAVLGDALGVGEVTGCADDAG
jgi:hypothetical protein